MKKILFTILIILLIVFAYFATFNGISLGKVEILSIKQIMEADNRLTSNIEEVNSLLKKDYPSRKENLATAKNELMERKEEYYSIAKLSSEGEIAKANTEEIYLREYLWVKIGTHATSNGLILRLDINTGDVGQEDIKNLAFTAQGEYVGIVKFISALENDDKLNFRIENFKMTKGSTALTATFTVRNVRIKSESVSSSTSNTTTRDTTEQQDNNSVSDTENTTDNNTQS